MTSWWRSWHGAPTDAKWLLIASKAKVKPGVVSAIFWALCDYASQNEERGSVSGFDRETYAVFSGFDLAQIDSVIAALTEKQLIDGDRLTAWGKRQPKREDDSSDRVTHHREKKRTVTHCNAPERTEQIETERADARPLLSKFRRDVTALYAKHFPSELPPDTNLCEVWEAQGLDPKLCLAAIAENFERSKKFKPLQYFSRMLAELHEKKVDVPQVTPEAERRTHWALLENERRTGRWTSTRIPKSDIPAALIAEFEQSLSLSKAG